MMTKQVNLKLPDAFFTAAQKYVESFGFRNLQDLALESMREKIFEAGEYDEDFSDREIELIDRLIGLSVGKKALGSREQLRDALK